MSHRTAGYQNWRFVVGIVLGLMLAPIAVTWLTYDLIGRVSTGANSQDHQRTRQVVVSAMGALESQMSALAVDNAYWDDAVRQGYGALDDDWVAETWGVGTAVATNYNAMMIVDAGEAQAVAGYKDGEPFRPRHGDYFAGKLQAMIDSLPADRFRFDTRTSILKTADGLALVGLAPLLPSSEDVKVPQDRPRYLLLLRYLKPEFITALGQQYVIADLALTDGTAAATAGEPVKDIAGDVVGMLRWKDARPGDAALSPVLGKAAIILAFMFLAMLAAGFMCLRLYRLLAEREKRARKEALEDALTGLPNRAALTASIASELEPAEAQVAVAFVDLDGFKEVNDTYDHETGDRLISAIAAGLKHLCGERGIVHRLGGDEFVAMFTGKNAEEQASRFARQVIGFLALPFDLEGRMAAVGASIGVAAASGGVGGSAELLRRADVAMYQAKTTGKNQVLVYSSSMDAERAETIAIANELVEIIHSGRLELAYQPIVSATSQQIIGVEALARWPRSSSRRLGPDKFIRVAEVRGLIDSLGDAVLAKACADARAWPGLNLSVNASPVQLNNPDFAARTLRIIAASGIAPERIEIEITESAVLANLAKAQVTFTALRQAGISIALDDFGVGYSSIAYLRALNFDRIKIDKSLVDNILGGASEQNIVQGAIRMAAGLIGRVTAEGIEKEEQIDLLRLNGCTELQGFYFSRPVAAHEITAILAGTAPGAAVA